MTNIIFSSIRNSLNNAVKNPGHPFRYFTLATISNDGSPRMRTVVLRSIDDQLNLFFYTDKRSKKVKHIEQQDSIGLLFMDLEKNIQISMQASALVIYDEKVLNAIWQQIPEKSRKDYTSHLPPGTKITDPENVNYIEGQHFFTAIKLVPQRIEYLQLKKNNHIRVIFNKENDEWSGHFLVP
ncbi:pyridoxamine 5'-phosphate oxidase family protein [Aquimarina pacifica]|uniref:pyridoxamine 5'-phosphate oxidase family protein n=1 Tax=Aquimarina pacifica TaxID=1296415 RepID=UPI000472A154|nr:pyridoxamine 5'-phosphate oxidase family protein [Aquimarina pacifica]